MSAAQSDIGPYSITPRWVVTACKGKPQALMLYVVLAHHADRKTDNGWTISREDLADEMGCSVETVDRAARVLVDAKAVEILRRRRKDSNQWAWSRYFVHTANPVVTSDDWRAEPFVTGDDTPFVTGDDGSTEPLFLLTPSSAQPPAERDNFAAFWAMYPRKVARRDAEAAWKRAITRAPARQVLEGLRLRVQWWDRARQTKEMIPYPATWLNRDQWTDSLEPVPTAPAASLAKAEADHAARERDEVSDAVAAGDIDLAWRMVTTKAGHRGVKWFVAVAENLGLTDYELGVLHGVTDAQITEVRTTYERLRVAALSHDVTQSPPILALQQENP